MKTVRGTLVVALAVGLGGLNGCDALPVADELHVTATLEVQVLDENGDVPLPTLVNFESDKFEDTKSLGTAFALDAFTYAEGKVSFTVGYNLQNTHQWVYLSATCQASGGLIGQQTSILYAEADAQSGGTPIAAITKTLTLHQ